MNHTKSAQPSGEPAPEPRAELDWLRDPRLLEAIRQEHASNIVATVERIAPDGFARRWMLAHAAELVDDLPGALQHCDAALQLAAQTATPCWMTDWLTLQGHVLRARLADPVHDPVAADACARRVFATAAGLARPTLLGHAAAARASLLLDGPAPGSTNDLFAVLAMLEDACTATTRADQAADGWARIEAVERSAPLHLAAWRVLFRANARGALRDGGARAWSWFRALRMHAGLQPGATAAAVPDGTTVVEWLALPGERLRVCLTDLGGSVDGELDVPVAVAARLQFDLGERIRGWTLRSAAAGSGPHDYPDRVAELCVWTHDAAARWSSLLLTANAAWSDGRTATLPARLAERGTSRLCLLPHGPTYLVPWGLLRTGDEPAWLERWAITVCSTWCAGPRAPRDEPLPSGVMLRHQPLRRASLPTSSDPDELFAALASCDRAWLAGHGVFCPPTHGASTLVTLGSGQRLALPLPQLIASALAAARMRQPAPVSLWLSICEAGEISRRAFLTEFATLAHAFLIAGVSCVIAPKWSATSLGRDAITEIVQQPRPLAAQTRALLARAYQPWRSCRDRDDLVRLAHACVERRQLPLCDVGAFDVHGHIDDLVT